MFKKVLFVVLLGILLIGIIGCGSSSEPELNKIEGIVANVEYIAKGSSFNAPDIKHTTVSFEDGRIKTFNGISNAVFQIGKRNIITYDYRNRIISVTITSGN